MRKHELAIANFICTFGEKGVLLDYLNEIVVPAIFTDTLIRTYGDTSYYIYEPSWIDLGSDGQKELAIVGRFIKDTILKRQQIIDNGTLKEDYEEMASAPSSFFVLLLTDHRLLYFAETQFAPEVGAFSSTLQIFLRRVWRLLLSREHKQRNGQSTYRQLQAEYPMPRLDIVPAAKTDKITELMRSFHVIDKIRFRLIKPNDETDASEVLQAVRDRLQPLKPSRLDLEVADSKGLDIEESISAVSEAAEGLNTGIVVMGSDEEGNRAKADNDEFALKIPIENVPETEQGLARRLYSEFLRQVENKSVRRGEFTEAVREALEAVRRFVL